MEENVDSLIRQFVVFKLGIEEYGMDIKKVVTIEKMMPIARVPKAPIFIKGVINLRGEIIPIMDLRSRIDFPLIEETENTRIIIIKIDEINIGIIIDEVDEVIQFKSNEIENITNFCSDISLDYIFGAGKINNRIVTLLNLEKLVKFGQ